MTSTTNSTLLAKDLHLASLDFPITHLDTLDIPQLLLVATGIHPDASDDVQDKAFQLFTRRSNAARSKGKRESDATSPALASQLHLAPLDFALDPLAELDSGQLALVAAGFHPESDVGKNQALAFRQLTRRRNAAPPLPPVALPKPEASPTPQPPAPQPTPAAPASNPAPASSSVAAKGDHPAQPIPEQRANTPAHRPVKQESPQRTTIKTEEDVQVSLAEQEKKPVVALESETAQDGQSNDAGKGTSMRIGGEDLGVSKGAQVAREEVAVPAGDDVAGKAGGPTMNAIVDGLPTPAPSAQDHTEERTMGDSTNDRVSARSNETRQAPPPRPSVPPTSNAPVQTPPLPQQRHFARSPDVSAPGRRGRSPPMSTNDRHTSQSYHPLPARPTSVRDDRDDRLPPRRYTDADRQRPSHEDERGRPAPYSGPPRRQADVWRPSDDRTYGRPYDDNSYGRSNAYGNAYEDRNRLPRDVEYRSGPGPLSNERSYGHTPPRTETYRRHARSRSSSRQRSRSPEPSGRRSRRPSFSPLPDRRSDWSSLGGQGNAFGRNDRYRVNRAAGPNRDWRDSAPNRDIDAASSLNGGDQHGFTPSNTPPPDARRDRPNPLPAPQPVVRPCFYHQRGGCKHGDECRYDHINNMRPDPSPHYPSRDETNAAGSSRVHYAAHPADSPSQPRQLHDFSDVPTGPRAGRPSDGTGGGFTPPNPVQRDIETHGLPLPPDTRSAEAGRKRSRSVMEASQQEPSYVDDEGSAQKRVLLDDARERERGDDDLRRRLGAHSPERSGVAAGAGEDGVDPQWAGPSFSAMHVDKQSLDAAPSSVSSTESIQPFQELPPGASKYLHAVILRELPSRWTAADLSEFFNGVDDRLGLGPAFRSVGHANLVSPMKFSCGFAVYLDADVQMRALEEARARIEASDQLRSARTRAQAQNYDDLKSTLTWNDLTPAGFKALKALLEIPPAGRPARNRTRARSANKIADADAEGRPALLERMGDLATKTPSASSKPRQLPPRPARANEAITGWHPPTPEANYPSLASRIFIPKPKPRGGELGRRVGA